MQPGLAYCEGSGESNSVPYAFEVNTLPLSHFPSPPMIFTGLGCSENYEYCLILFFFSYLRIQECLGVNICILPCIHCN